LFLQNNQQKIKHEGTCYKTGQNLLVLLSAILKRED